MSSKKTTTFSMPVVLQNLPPAETLNQVVDNLNYLCNVFDEAFDTISTQINEERNKIKSISERVSKASSKTDLIAKYPNKSTTVYSHCTFPKDKLDDDAPLVTAIESTKCIKHPRYKLAISERLKRAPNCDTLKLFHSVSEKTANKVEDKVIGLGRLPNWISNVGDCLLFNTETNPYLKYEAIQNLEGVEGVARKLDEYNMALAPTSIRDKHALIDKESYDIAYRPDLENVPVFQVNTTLAGFSGMSGLALDEKWHGMRKEQQKIAPSGVDFGALPELEALPDFDGGDDFGFGPNETTSGGPPPKAPTPPPQQPPPKQQQAQKQNTSTPSGPPPSDAATKPKAAAAPAKKKSGGGAAAGAAAGRADLLSAIRAGKKLSKATARKERDAAKKPVSKRPMSLMDTLKLKLQARNNLMRGKTEPTQAKKKKDVQNELPSLDDIDELDDAPLAKSGLKSVSKRKTKPKDNANSPDHTGLNLKNVPASMRTSMLLLDDEMSSGTDQSWNSDDN